MGYAAAAVAIVACPFCREIFEKGEEKRCPVCGIELEAFERLPPSVHTDAELEEGGVPLAPEHERLPWTHAGRGRGALVLLAILGLVLFFLPWVHLTLPYIDSRTGFDLSKRIGWSWGAAVAWVVLIPTIASRRTIAELRGARVAAGFLSAVPGLTATILLVFPPHGGLIPVRFTWGWAVWATLATSVAAVAASLALGGRVDDIRVARGSSQGRPLH